MRWFGALAILCFSSSAALAQTTVPGFCSQYPQTEGSGDWHASRVFYQNGRLNYVTDSGNNRIPDYSYSGYGYGQKAIPSVPQVQTLSPTTGDQTARIQAALDQVGARTPDANGIRGALVLAPGAWEIRGTLRVNRGGVVLRGSGNGSSTTTDTILRATGNTPHQRPVIVLGSGSGSWTLSATHTNITDALVPVNAMSFNVASTAGYGVGQAIVIHHPSTQAWLNAIDGGGMQNEASWTAGSVDIQYYRRITAISGTRISIDAPIYNHLNRSLAQSWIAAASTNVITQAAVENLRIDIVTASSTDENHAWNGVHVLGAHESWVRGVTVLHFGAAGIALGDNAVRVTVQDCQALDPHGVRTGGRFYNFNNNRRSQLNLFTRCRATLGRHGYISNGTSDSSGLVYHRSSQQGGGSEGGHRRWVQGVLYDNHDEVSSGQVLLINRGDFGTSHGWAAVHSTVWKYDGETLVQKPPTGQNYAFNVAGTFRSSVYFPGPFGVQERQSGRLVPESLYEAQLCERLGAVGSPTPTPTPEPTLTPTPITVTPTPTPTATPPGPGSEITPGASGVTASTSDGNLPANAVDNNLATRWSGNGDGAWLKLDLGSVRPVGHVTIAWFSGNTRASLFDLQRSDDNVNWTNIVTGGRSGGTTTLAETFDFDDVEAQWIRYLGHGNSDPTKCCWNSVAEISVFAGSLTPPTPSATPTPTATPAPTPTATPTLTPTPPPTYVEVTLAPSAVTASTNDGNLPANTIDGNLATRWSGSGDGAWIQFDLGTTRTVGHVAVGVYQGNTRQARFDLQVATTAGVWKTVFAGSSSGTTTAEQTFDFTDEPARWVRYLGHGNTANTWNSVTEVSIFAVP